MRNACWAFAPYPDTSPETHHHRHLPAMTLFLKGNPYSITERRVPELIQVLGSQPAGDLSHKPGGRLRLLSARPAVTLATIKRTGTNFAAWFVNFEICR